MFRRYFANLPNAFQIAFGLLRIRLQFGDHILQLLVVADEIAASRAMVFHKFRMVFGELFRGRFVSRPHAFADGFQHDGGHLLHGVGILLFKCLRHPKFQGIIHIDLFILVPQMVFDGVRFHRLPTERILENRRERLQRRRPFLHHFGNVLRIQDGRMGLHHDGFGDFLYLGAARRAQVVEISGRILSRDIFHGQIDAARELIDVVQ